MRLTVVGCAAAWGRGGDAASSCYLVEEGATALVLDLGQGAFARLAALRDPASLTAVAISHPHPDHCVDLIPLRHFLRYDAAATPGTVALLGPESLPARFDAFLPDASAGETGFLGDLAFTPLEPGEIALGNLRLTVRRVTHTTDSFAFRVHASSGTGAGLVYSGDCGVARELEPLLRTGDTLLAEASFGAGPVPSGVPHLDAGEAAAAARDGHATRLVLTHLQPNVDPAAAFERARQVFDGEIVLARPGLALEI